MRQHDSGDSQQRAHILCTSVHVCASNHESSTSLKCSECCSILKINCLLWLRIVNPWLLGMQPLMRGYQSHCDNILEKLGLTFPFAIIWWKRELIFSQGIIWLSWLLIKLSFFCGFVKQQYSVCTTFFLNKYEKFALILAKVHHSLLRVWARG